MFISIFLFLFQFTLKSSELPKCFFINSYHKGYDWSDGVEKSLYENLQGVCDLETYYLNAKKEPQEEILHKKAIEVKNLILAKNPAVIIASDDNASEEVIVPYFKDSEFPIVFCGINWSTKKHGYPFKNATGMIEVTPVQPLIREAKRVFKNIRTATFLAGDVEADRENYQIFNDIYKKEGVKLRSLLVNNMEDWIKGYKRAQSSDLVLVVNNSGIKGWDAELAKKTILEETIKPTITSHEYMVKYSMLSFTKIAGEQGEWAAEVTKEILKGTPISKIPVATNRRWNIYSNEFLLKKIKRTLPKILKKSATIVEL